MEKDQEIKELICEIGRRIYEKGFVASNDGNISVRVGDNEVYVTPTGVSKGYMTPDMLIKTDIEGNILDGTWKPSSEAKMHYRVYKERKDINAVVHAHPPYATAFSIVGKPLNKPIMTEAVFTFGSIPMAKYATPSTQEVPDSVGEFVQICDAMLLQNHGALTYSHDLMDAYYKMESIEFYARLNYITENLGGARMLTKDQVDALLEIRKKSGAPGRHPGCDEFGE